MASTEEELQKRLEETRRKQARARARAQGLRETTGNEPSRSARQTFQEGRRTVRGAARSAGRVAGAAAAETAGVAGEAAGGAAEGLGFNERARAAGRATTTKAAEGLRRARSGIRGLGSKLLRGTGVVGAGLALGQEALDTPKDEIGTRFSRLNPVTVLPTAAADFGLRRARGEGVGQALSGAARGAVAPISSGFVNQPEDDPFRGTQPTLRESILNRNDDGQQFLEQVQGVTGAQPGAGGGANQQQNVQVGAPAAGLRQPAQAGQRRFGDPGTGFIRNEQTGDVTVLNTPPAQETQGLRAVQPQQDQTQNERILERLAGQAERGGLASAFVGAAAGGNVLREQAAQRQRQEQRQQQQQEFQNDLAITLQGQRAKLAALPLKAREQFQEEVRTSLDALTAAENEGNEQAVNREKDVIAQHAINDPEGGNAAIFSTVAAQEIQELAGPDLLSLIGISPGRSIVDYLAESEEPVVSLNPENTVFFDRDSGEIRQRSTTPDEPPQKLVDFNALPQRTQDFLRARGVLTGRDEKGRKRLERGGRASRGELGLRQ